MKKKIVFVLSIIMILGLAGCGKNQTQQIIMNKWYKTYIKIREQK